MAQRIAGPGLGLPLPQQLYPAELLGGAYDAAGSNRQTLAPGQAMPVPPGEWYVGLGMYLILQHLDPITNTWFATSSGGWSDGFRYVFSDGYTTRIFNPLCVPIGGVVTDAGSGYAQASTTIAVTGGGGSTWLPIIGGQLVSLSMGTTVGAGYGIAPLCMIPPPPPAASNPNGVGGIPASGYFGIANGTISGFTFTNPGAGYPGNTTFTVPAYADPYDPNLATGITLGTLTFSTTASGSLTGVLCTNSGAPLSNPANFTLTVSGAGTQATCTAIIPQTIATASVTGGGTGYGTVAALLTTVGGAPATAVFAASPETLFIAGKPRPADIQLAITGTGTVAAQLGTIYDGGFFYSAPNPVIVPGPQAGAVGSIAGPTIALTMGSRPDIAIFQPAA